MENFAKYNAMDFLETKEDIAEYLTACANESEPVFFQALGKVIKHFGVKKMAEKATLQRTGLYKSFNEKAKNTQYATVSKVLKAMNLRIKIETINS